MENPWPKRRRWQGNHSINKPLSWVWDWLWKRVQVCPWLWVQEYSDQVFYLWVWRLQANKWHRLAPNQQPDSIQCDHVQSSRYRADHTQCIRRYCFCFNEFHQCYWLIKHQRSLESIQCGQLWKFQYIRCKVHEHQSSSSWVRHKWVSATFIIAFYLSSFKTNFDSGSAIFPRKVEFSK